MNKRTYHAPDIDLVSLGQLLHDWFAGQEFETQQMLADNGSVTIQARKEGTWRMLTGMTSALSTLIYYEGENVAVEMGNAKWIDKGAVAAVGALIFWPALVTAGVGAYQQNQLMTNAWKLMEDYIKTNSAYGDQIMGFPAQPTAAASPAPAAPAVPGPAAPPPPVNLGGPVPQKVDSAAGGCAQCGQPLREGAKFCDNCGAPTVVSCPSCGKPLRSGARFCDECGSPVG